MEPLPKRRKALTDADRLKIRLYHRQHPKVSQTELATWFTAKSGHNVNQSMISKILSPTFAYLDPQDSKKDKQSLESKRKTPASWPALEAALFE